MNLQGKNGLIAIGASIILLVGVLFVLFRTTLGERPHNVSPDNAPGYARQSGMTPTGGAPAGPRGAPGGVPSPYGEPPVNTGASTGTPSYGQTPGGGGTEPGRAPQ